jgi:hypothetical protein
MSTQTETIETAYGDVQVELVECDSCGNRVKKEETVPFEIGDRQGRACEYCEEDGPMSFPERVRLSEEEPLFTAALMVAFAPLGVALTLLLLTEDDISDGAPMAAGMGIGGVLWTLGFLLIVSEPFRASVLGVLPL